jgi:hypothetical protein
MVLSLLLACALSHAPTADSLSFAEGRARSAKEGEVLLVLVHGSDWQPFGERLFDDVWQDAGFATSAEVILADVDILQDPKDGVRAANDERNKGWKKKESGLRTYPSVIAYAPDGARIGNRQGRDLPKELDAARLALLEFAACCRMWSDIGGDLDAAREAKDTARELELLIARDRLPLQRSSKLLDEVKRLDPEGKSGHLARLTFPYWNTLVSQATAEAKSGKGAEAEERLSGMLANEAYTLEQRAVIHLALGSAYRRWEGHGVQAGESFEAAWRAAPDSVCGRAGMRLFLKSYGGPSLAFGWTDRHTSPVTEDGLECKALFWTVLDLPQTLESGAYRLRLKRTHGGELPAAHVRLLSDGMSKEERTLASALTKTDPVQEIVFTLPEGLNDASLRIELALGDKSRGTIEWTKLP